MRALSRTERERAADLATIPNAAVGLFEVTQTQVAKSIVDANASIRLALSTMGLHDFGEQAQGPDAKVMVDASWLTGDVEERTQLSLYRPNTKQGDPRFWPLRSADKLTSGHIVALVATPDRVYLIDLADPRFEDARDVLLSEYGFELAISADAQVLLGRLRQIASAGPIASPRTGTTAIGAAIEFALGIEQNSSRAPDFRGIEIKAKRKAAAVRSTLFACVPDWNLSACKSSAAILDKYGYRRDDDHRLYCQVNAGRPNSQGLQFVVDYEKAIVTEICVDATSRTMVDVACWPFQRLSAYMGAKHRETFWIDAISHPTPTGEEFTLVGVEHTRSPRVGALPYLIDQDVVSMDHLIKRTAAGKVTEKGPLFKMDRSNLGLLFPIKQRHALP